MERGEDGAMTRMTRMIAVGAAVLCMVSAAPATPAADTEQKKLDIRQNDTMADFLDGLAGTTVEVALRSGSTLTGRLTKVHQNLAVLSELRGKEFYDAVIRIEDISAVTVRMRDK
jgi:small nuclear ribonucleoprotein (snRNP)-like protein